jgi:L-iditol 2-dehydrogenase
MFGSARLSRSAPTASDERTHTFPLAEVPTAIKYAREWIDDAIKVVVKIRDTLAEE